MTASGGEEGVLVVHCDETTRRSGNFAKRPLCHLQNLKKNSDQSVFIRKSNSNVQLLLEMVWDMCSLHNVQFLTFDSHSHTYLKTAQCPKVKIGKIGLIFLFPEGWAVVVVAVS